MVALRGGFVAWGDEKYAELLASRGEMGSRVAPAVCGDGAGSPECGRGFALVRAWCDVRRCGSTLERH